MFFMSAAPLSAILQGFIMDHFGVETSLAMGAACLWGAVWYASELATHYPNAAVAAPAHQHVLARAIRSLPDTTDEKKKVG
jgi:hypothetical protein